MARKSTGKLEESFEFFGASFVVRASCERPGTAHAVAAVPRIHPAEARVATLAAQAELGRAHTGSQITDHSARGHKNCRRHARGHWQFTAHRGRHPQA